MSQEEHSPRDSYDISNKFKDYAFTNFTVSQRANTAPKDKPLTTPLHELETQEEKNFAVKMSTTILKYTSVILVTPSESSALFREMMETLLKIPYKRSAEKNSLFQEFYCQILRILTSNINPFSLKKAWELLCTGCCVLGVHNKEMLNLIEFFLNFAKNSKITTTFIFDYTLNSLQSSTNSKGIFRTSSPSSFETSCIRQGTDMELKINYISKSYVIEIHPYTLVSSVLQQRKKIIYFLFVYLFFFFILVFTKLELSEEDKQTHCLSAATKGIKEYPLATDSYLADAISKWEKANEKDTQITQGKSHPDLVLKKYFYDNVSFDEKKTYKVVRNNFTYFVEDLDLPKLETDFHLFVSDIQKELLPVSIEECYHLIAIWSLFNNSPEKKKLEIKQEVISSCFPEHFVKRNWGSIVEFFSNSSNANMVSKYEDLVDKKPDLMIAFIRQVYTLSFFGSIVFSVTHLNVSHFLSFGPSKILLCTSNPLKVFHSSTYNDSNFYVSFNNNNLVFSSYSNDLEIVSDDPDRIINVFHSYKKFVESK